MSEELPIGAAPPLKDPGLEWRAGAVGRHCVAYMEVLKPRLVYRARADHHSLSGFEQSASGWNVRALRHQVETSDVGICGVGPTGYIPDRQSIPRVQLKVGARRHNDSPLGNTKNLCISV